MKVRSEYLIALTGWIAYQYHSTDGFMDFGALAVLLDVRLVLTWNYYER